MVSQKCLSCRVQFESAADHRTHFQSEWHCYNLKRKIATLPPLTQDEFTERKELAANENTKKVKGSHKKADKKRKNKKDVQGDIEEQIEEPQWKSGDNPRALGLEDEDWEDMSDDEEMEEDVDESDDRLAEISEAECVLDGVNQREITLNECFFTGKVFNTVDENVKHMESLGFFIPDKEHLVDRDGLLRYVARKIGVGNVCLVCNENGKAFYSLAAVRQHMLNQGHCRLNMVGEKMFEYSDFYDFDSSDEEEDDLQDGTSVGEMVLKDGSVIGHRSLWKYFKQSFNPRTDLVLAQSKRKQQINQYRAIGYYGTHAEQQYEKKQFKQAARWKKHHALALGIKNNKTMMTHFKRRDGFCQ